MSEDYSDLLDGLTENIRYSDIDKYYDKTKKSKQLNEEELSDLMNEIEDEIEDEKYKEVCARSKDWYDFFNLLYTTTDDDIIKKLHLTLKHHDAYTWSYWFNLLTITENISYINILVKFFKGVLNNYGHLYDINNPRINQIKSYIENNSKTK